MQSTPTDPVYFQVNTGGSRGGIPVNAGDHGNSSTLYVNPDAGSASIPLNGVGYGVLSLPLNCDAGMYGRVVYAQGLSLDPTASGCFPFTHTEGLAATLGR